MFSAKEEDLRVYQIAPMRLAASMVEGSGPFVFKRFCVPLLRHRARQGQCCASTLDVLHVAFRDIVDVMNCVNARARQIHRLRCPRWGPEQAQAAFPRCLR